MIRRMVCAECRRALPGDVRAAVPKGGYADPPRPVHVHCFEASPYLKNRFVLVLLPRTPTWWMRDWMEEWPSRQGRVRGC